MYDADAVVVDAVVPGRVLSHVGETRGRDVLSQGRHHFAGRHFEVAVDVFECIDAVGARGNAFDAEMAAAVGASHAFEGQSREGRVVEVAVQAHEQAFLRFEVFGRQHIAGNLHRVNGAAGREVIGEIAQRVALVAVFDGV